MPRRKSPDAITRAFLSAIGLHPLDDQLEWYRTGVAPAAFVDAFLEVAVPASEAVQESVRRNGLLPTDPRDQSLPLAWDVLTFLPEPYADNQELARAALAKHERHWQTALVSIARQLESLAIYPLPFVQIVTPQPWVSIHAVDIKPHALVTDDDTADPCKVHYLRRPLILWPADVKWEAHWSRVEGKPMSIPRLPLDGPRPERHVPIHERWLRRARQIVSSPGCQTTKGRLLRN